jgi:outer membrane protein OmpA-like peptidoglycan-associated protein
MIAIGIVLGVLFPVLAAPAAEEVNAAAYSSGARQVDEQGDVKGEIGLLLDGDPASQWEPGIEEAAKPVIIELAEPFDLTAVEAVNSNNEADYPGISVKKLKVETGPKPGGPWSKLADLELKKGTAPQRVAAKAAKVRCLRLTLLSNHGNAEWYGMGELRALGRRVQARTVKFNGAWDTDYGEMVLAQTGERVTGCYGHGGEDRTKAGLNTVDGTLEGTGFAGIWREENADDPASAKVGSMAFVMTAEGGLSGSWGWEGGTGKDLIQRWDGTARAAKPTIVCEKPEKGLAAELKKKGRVVLRGILFDTGKDTLKPESLPVLDALAAAMKGDPGRRYLIEGHTDDRGGQALNQTLSEKRATSVKTWLTKAGVEAARLTPKGFGMSKPAMPNDTDAGRAANRRVEVAAE